MTPNSSSHFSLQSLIRKNIWDLHPYRCARDDYQSGILLDANENALGPSLPEMEASLNLHRYPDPSQVHVKSLVAQLRDLPSPEHVFLGVGSDEVIDLLMRVCCNPGRDKILITPPTYGMYSVCAQVNDLTTVKVPLLLDNSSFQVPVDEIKATVARDQTIKIIFLCSPGNPTGTLVPLTVIQDLLDFPAFRGLVVVDEAYIDFAGPNVSATEFVRTYPNLCVMQTLSKSFGLAAIRLGMALAQPPLITILSNTKAPYNISTLTANAAEAALSAKGLQVMRDKVATLQDLRDVMIRSLESLREQGLGTPIGGSHANFLLVPVLKKGATNNNDYDSDRSLRVYKRLAEEKSVIVRYRGSEYGCGGCLRITVGTPKENQELLFCLTQVLSDE